jgi:hypothetical protein
MLGIFDLLSRVTSTGPAAARLVMHLNGAREGRPESLAYFRSRQAVLDVGAVFFPGREWLVQDILDRGETLLDLTRRLLNGEPPPYVEGEFRPAPDVEPWAGFVRRLKSQPSGSHIILGPRGSGKTTLAKKLAWVYYTGLGYDPEFVNMYRADKPAWGRTILPETLLRRIEKLEAHLRSEAVPDPDESKPKQMIVVEPPAGKKVIVIDEASMAFERGIVDAFRNAVFAAMLQVRHVNWHMVFVGQYARTIPLELFTGSTVWVKQPHGNETDLDRDNPLIQQIWTEAADAFQKIRSTPWYQGALADPRSWAYVVSPELGYKGMAPFEPAPEKEEDGNGR